MTVIDLEAPVIEVTAAPSVIRRGNRHPWLATTCVVLGTLCLTLIAWDQTGTFAALTVGSTLFFGPGLALASWRPQSLAKSAWLVFPVSCALILLATRLLLALELYRPRPIAVGVATAVAAVGVARLAYGFNARTDLDRRNAQLPWRRLFEISVDDVVRFRATGWKVACAGALAAWFVGCQLTRTSDLTKLGLLGALSPLWYVGLALAAVAVVLGIRSSTAGNARPLAAATIVALLVLHGTSPMVYEAARYAWTYKHIGFADYFAVYHDNNRASVDIYNAFPAYFSSLGVVAGTVTSRGLVVLARWWPLMIEASCMLIICRLFRSVKRDRRVPWAAALLFLTANWIGQDYFSPQSVSLVLALTIYAIVFRQFERTKRSDEDGPGPSRLSANVWPVVAVLACWVAIVVTHPLTPFLVLPGLLVGFPLFGFRPRLLPAVMAVIALGYAWMQRGIVEDQGIGRHLGSVVENVQSRGTTNGIVPTRVPEFDYYFMAAIALSMLVLFLGALGARTLLRSTGRRSFVGWACQAISPTLFLVVESYGQEGVLRAFLFSLPWLCLPGAMLIARTAPARRRRFARVFLPLVVGAAATLSIVAFFVRDLQFAVAPSDIEVIHQFEDANPSGGLLIGTGVLPEEVTATYFKQQYVVLASPERLVDGTIDTASTLLLMKEQIVGYDRDVYLAFGPTLTNRSVFDGIFSKVDLVALQRAVLADSDWRLVFRDGQ
ncbi:MAG: hypothetical protein JWM12_3189, partial [Ilumatobacteraceae bacterium]|nr:hypothetical protein [Ilumatobacteraceae bacterium]